MPELCFALFVKRLFALLTAVLFVCLVCSRLFLKFCLGKPAHPPIGFGQINCGPHVISSPALKRWESSKPQGYYS